jgi:hypothetical protein
MWEFYLASCEAAFRWRDLVVFQVQLTHHLGVTPITRSYLYREDSSAIVPAPCSAETKEMKEAGGFTQAASRTRLRPSDLA